MKVFLTGASSGLGEALARHYASGGATLGLVARRGEWLGRLRESLPVACETYPCDVRDADALRASAEDFLQRHGTPDIVIANAGVSYGNLTEHPADAETFREMLEVNVLGMVNTFQPFIVPMRTERRGRLAGIASVAGLRGLPGATAYSASKAAAIRYLEGLRVEMRGSGVAVITVCPGYVATPMTARNPYRMPFILEADDAARRIARVIEARRRYAIVPWPMALVGRVLAMLPGALYDRLAARAGRKPRKAA